MSPPEGTQSEPRPNSSFSTSVPGLQLAWDSTSLGTFKECPRKYKFTIIDGWVPRFLNVHFKFGLVVHGARERYEHAIASGASYDDAVDVALKWALEDTWDRRTGRPWISDLPQKTRFTAIRTIVWFLDEFRNDPLRTVILANGKPAVELSFRFETDIAPLGIPTERFLLCGHLDRVVEHEGSIYINDIKTTKSTIDSSFFAGFSPDNQLTLYTLAGKVVLALPIRGIMVDGAQVAVTFSRFLRGIVPRHEETINEWYRELQLWLRQAELYAHEQLWPGNDKACFRCQFRDICAKPPAAREQWLEAGFVRRTWDPLQARGDI